MTGTEVPKMENYNFRQTPDNYVIETQRRNISQIARKIFTASWLIKSATTWNAYLICSFFFEQISILQTIVTLLHSWANSFETNLLEFFQHFLEWIKFSNIPV